MTELHKYTYFTRLLIHFITRTQFASHNCGFIASDACETSFNPQTQRRAKVFSILGTYESALSVNFAT